MQFSDVIGAPAETKAAIKKEDLPYGHANLIVIQGVTPDQFEKLGVALGNPTINSTWEHGDITVTEWVSRVQNTGQAAAAVKQ